MRRAPASGGAGDLGSPRILSIKDLGGISSPLCSTPPPPLPLKARHPPPAPEPSRRPAGAAPNWVASRPCAGHQVRCYANGIRRALALPVSPTPSPVAPALAQLLVLSPTAAEETDGAGARRRGSEPGESADPARPARHPRETPSGAPGSCARARREGPRPPRP
jgi:hypothetical protein